MTRKTSTLHTALLTTLCAAVAVVCCSCACFLDTMGIGAADQQAWKGVEPESDEHPNGIEDDVIDNKRSRHTEIVERPDDVREPHPLER